MLTLTKTYHVVVKDHRCRVVKDLTRQFVERDDAVRYFNDLRIAKNSANGNPVNRMEDVKNIRYLTLEMRYDYGKKEARSGHTAVPEEGAEGHADG